MKRVRLVVVDDHALFRAGLVSLLGGMNEFQIVGEANDGVEALEVIRRVSPDIVLLDVNMPHMNGLEAVEAIRQAELPCRVIMLTISKHEDDLFAAINAGADGYLLKNAEPEELRKSILLVSEGNSVLSPEVTRAVFKVVTGGQNVLVDGGLSKRELEVLERLAMGKTTTQISTELFVSENTVKTHVRHILNKLEASNRAEAVSKAIQMGLIRSNRT